MTIQYFYPTILGRQGGGPWKQVSYLDTDELCNHPETESHCFFLELAEILI